MIKNPFLTYGYNGLNMMHEMGELTRANVKADAE